jgi:molybdopterin converting factor small subunit
MNQFANEKRNHMKTKQVLTSSLLLINVITLAGTLETSSEYQTLNEAIHLQLSTQFREELKKRYELTLPLSNETAVQELTEEIVEEIKQLDEKEAEEIIKERAEKYFTHLFKKAHNEYLRKKVRDIFEQCLMRLLKEHYDIQIPGRYDPKVMAFGEQLTEKALAIEDTNEREAFIRNECQTFLDKLFN